MLNPVLLVDDSAKDVELALYVLDRSTLANPVNVVRDGEEALDYLVCRQRYADRPQINPALILLDIKMPKMNGIEVLQILRLTPRFRNIPVMVLTTSQEEEDFVRSANLGVSAFILKPLDVTGFSVTIARLGLGRAAPGEGHDPELRINPCI